MYEFANAKRGFIIMIILNQGKKVIKISWKIAKPY